MRSRSSLVLVFILLFAWSGWAAQSGVVDWPVEATLCGAPKLEVCHVPPGNPDNAHIICIDDSALAAHSGHNDQLTGDPELNCSDGVDNDCDGAIDDDDFDCVSTEDCMDGIDNDGDGAIDGHDPDCCPCKTEVESACGGGLALESLLDEFEAWFPPFVCNELADYTGYSSGLSPCPVIGSINLWEARANCGASGCRCVVWLFNGCAPEYTGVCDAGTLKTVIAADKVITAEEFVGCSAWITGTANWDAFCP